MFYLYPRIRNNKRSQFTVLTLCFFASLVYIFPTTKNETTEFYSIKKSAFSASRRIFRGTKRRIFHGKLLFRNTDLPAKLPNRTSENGCKVWFIFAVKAQLSESTANGVLSRKESCIVVVLEDQQISCNNFNKNSSKEITGRLTCIDNKTQQLFETQFKSEMVKMLPRDYFGRKNIGYLYAISHGAQKMLDVDDHTKFTESEFMTTNQHESSMLVLEMARYNFSTFNPYPMIGFPCMPREPPSDPKALELPSCNHSIVDDARMVSLPLSNVAVIQSVYIENPDVDPISNLTMQLSTNITNNTRFSVVVPRTAYSIFNSRATLFKESALWMLYLPVTVDKQLSEILRNYVAQRLARDTGQRIVFSSHQTKNPRKNIGNHHNQTNLINLPQRSEVLIYVLDDINLKAKTLPGRIEEVWVELYERKFVEIQDIFLIQEWIISLLSVGYRFPELRLASGTTSTDIDSNLALNTNKNLKCHQAWPDLDLFLTMANGDYNEFRSQLLRSFLLFWPLNKLNMVTVLDEEAKDSGFENLFLNATKPFNTSRVMYNAPSPYYGKRGHDRQQLLMFWADNYTIAEYVGFVDTDCMFVTPVDQEDLFENGKPVVIGLQGRDTVDWWDGMPKSTWHILKKQEVMRCMNYFPVIIKTVHLKSLRDYIFKIHAQNMNEFFRDMDKRAYSQFNIMCNYYRNEYVFHIQEYHNGKTGHTLGQPASGAEAGFTPRMYYPKPRVAIHTSYHFTGASEKSLLTIFRQGVCFDVKATKSANLIKFCEDNKIVLENLNVHLFHFENHDWRYHSKVQESFDRRQNRRSYCPHPWNLQNTVVRNTLGFPTIN